MRNGNVCGIAIRLPGGRIFTKRMLWRPVGQANWLQWPFFRGFPILLESLVNGIRALNLSAVVVGFTDYAHPVQLVLNIFLAALVAIALFIGAPHLLALLMMLSGFGGDVESLSFHLWDGLFKCLIFIGYIAIISCIPDIHRMFEYHGAEHKIIHAWEQGVGFDEAKEMSRLHPRCGTTFLLFVICVAIIAQAVFVPFFLRVMPPATEVVKHVLSLCCKILLVIPVSACAYELIRLSDKMQPGILSALLQGPGLALQKLTTREPGLAQLEVAQVALCEALAEKCQEL